EFEKGKAGHRRLVQGQAAGAYRYPALGRPSRGAGRPVQPGCQDRNYRKGAESRLILNTERWEIVARFPTWAGLIQTTFSRRLGFHQIRSLSSSFLKCFWRFVGGS